MNFSLIFSLYSWRHNAYIFMISVDDALSLIVNTISSKGIEEVALIDALGSVLATDLITPINMPPFRQSAMDGYALRLNGNVEYNLIEEAKAGDSKKIALKPGDAIRIFTGALVPDDADTVVIQEHVVKRETKIEVKKLPEKAANIRPMGEQVKIGETVLKKGTVLNEAAIGFIAGLGITAIKVFKKPSVAILATGNELQEPGTELKLGCIYESNAIMLTAALRRVGIDQVKIYKAKDDYTETKEAIKTALDKVDVLLISGGISVGDYDFVKDALTENNVEEIFYKVNQKPGKPLYFGKKENKTVFALPGNPASSLTCFYVYVLTALRRMMGYEQFELERGKAKITSTLNNPTGKTLLLKAIIKDEKATVLTGQASSMLNTYAISNALVYIPKEIKTVNEGDEVEYLNLVF